MALKSDDRCLLKLKPDEPFHVFRAGDTLAPHFVRTWAQRAFYHGLPRSRFDDAMDQARQMEAWPKRDHLKAPYDLADIGDDEPIFVVRGQDILAAELVRDWAYRARSYGLRLPAVNDYLATADLMDKWPTRRYPD